MAKKKPLTENELYKAAPLLSYLDSDEYHPEKNVLAQIEEVATLREAIVYSAKGSLKFIGEIDGEELTIDIKMEGLKKCGSVDRKIFVKATVGEFVQTIDDSECTLYIGFKHFMDIVKCVVPFRKGHEIPKEFNLPLEFWAETEEGKKFFEELSGLGFRSNREAKYFYEAPCEDTDMSLILPILEYNENNDHFMNTSDEHQLHIRAKTEHTTALFYFDAYSPFLKYAQKYGIDYTTELVGEWGYDGPKHKYGVTADKFLEFVKKVIKHNTDRLDAISEQHGGLTWRILNFRETTDKFEFPVYGYEYNCTHLPQNEIERIKTRIEKRRVERLAEVEEILSKGKFKNIITYLKEHGKLSLMSHQYGDEINLRFSMPVTFEIPVKHGESFTKKKLEVTGGIWVSGKAKEKWSWREPKETFYPNNLLIDLPFCYKTAEGEFPSWDEAVAAEGDIKYGGQFCTGKRASTVLENNSRHGDYAITDDTLARFEKILLNIKADHERYLVDCHYKDAPTETP